MTRKIVFALIVFLFGMTALHIESFAQDDKIVQVALQTVKTQMRIPPDMGIKFIEKQESAIAGFYSVKFIVSAPDRDVPIVVYVDQAAEKVIIGNLFIKGENITRKEAGEPKPRKLEMGQLEIERSPLRGPAEAKVTIVEFSNFECPYCLRSWTKIKELMDKNPQDIRYIFKHYPLQAKGRPFDLSSLVAATQELSSEAFWLIHDFMFSSEGQAIAKKETEMVKGKIEQLLQEKGHDVAAFKAALEAGKGKKRVEEDLAVGGKIRVRGTPTTILNGTYLLAPISDKMLEEYLKK